MYVHVHVLSSLCIVYTVAVVGFETPNKYSILNSNGEIIFQAVEGEFFIAG